MILTDDWKDDPRTWQEDGGSEQEVSRKKPNKTNLKQLTKWQWERMYQSSP